MGKQFLDQYSLLHFSQGVVAYFWGTPFHIWVITHASFEFLENSGEAFDQQVLVVLAGGETRGRRPHQCVGRQSERHCGILVCPLDGFRLPPEQIHPSQKWLRGTRPASPRRYRRRIACFKYTQDDLIGRSRPVPSGSRRRTGGTPRRSLPTTRCFAYISPVMCS